MINPGTYNTHSSHLPDGVYQNSDTDRSKLMIKLYPDQHIELITSYQELAQTPLSEIAYFRPACTPAIKVPDSSAGSSFESVWVPTAEYIFKKNGNTVEVSCLSKKTSISEYEILVDRYLTEYIHTIYKKHDHVVLGYSGGVDSTVLLSYIIALGYGLRTEVVSFQNHTQSHAECLHLDKVKQENMTKIFEKLKGKVANCRILHFTYNDMVRLVNTVGYEEFVCYTTTFTVEHYKNTAFLFGAGGNNVLLHRYYFIDDLCALYPGTQAELERLKKIPGWYTSSIYDYTPTELVPLRNRYLGQKPYHSANRINGNTMYNPLNEDQIFQELRQVDFSKLTVESLFNASFAKLLISNNVGALFDGLISTESLYDLDNLESVIFDVDDLDLTKLQIPSILCHNPVGLSFVEHSLATSVSSGALPLNTVVSIKNLQYLAERIFRVLQPTSTLALSA